MHRDGQDRFYWTANNNGRAVCDCDTVRAYDEVEYGLKGRECRLDEPGDVGRPYRGSLLLADPRPDAPCHRGFGIRKTVAMQR